MIGLRSNQFVRRTCAVFALLGVASLGYAADAIVTADTYISSAQPAANFGTAVNMNIVGGANVSSGLVQFDISKLPTDPSLISKAILTLYVNKVNASGGIDVKLLAASWTETGVNNNT